MNKKIVFILLIIVLLTSFGCNRRTVTDYETSKPDDASEETHIVSTEVIDFSEINSQATTDSVNILTETQPNSTIEMPNFDNLINDFSRLEKSFYYDNSDSKFTIDVVARIMLEDVLNGLCEKQEDMSFQILEYKDLNLSFYKDIRRYGYLGYIPQESDNFLEISADVSIRYKGYISPIIYSENGTDDFYIINLYDWVLIKEQYNYYLYPSGYYYLLHQINE